jgi:acyl carrier protein
MNNDVMAVLTEYIRNETGYAGPLSPDDDLLAKHILDSFSVVSLAVFAEQHFGAEFEDEDMSRVNLASLNSLAALVEKRRPAK